MEQDEVEAKQKSDERARIREALTQAQPSLMSELLREAHVMAEEFNEATKGRVHATATLSGAVLMVNAGQFTVTVTPASGNSLRLHHRRGDATKDRAVPVALAGSSIVIGAERHTPAAFIENLLKEMFAAVAGASDA